MCFAPVPMSAVNCPSTVSCELDPYAKMRLLDGYSWVAHVLLTLLKLPSSIMLADAPVSIIICTGTLLTNTETVGVLVLVESPRVYRYSSSLLSVKSGCSWVATCQTCDLGFNCHWRGDNVALCLDLACFVRHIRATWMSLPHLLQVWPLAGQGLSLWGHVSSHLRHCVDLAGVDCACFACTDCGFLENFFRWILFTVAFTVPENCSIPDRDGLSTDDVGNVLCFWPRAHGNCYYFWHNHDVMYDCDI